MDLARNAMAAPAPIGKASGLAGGEARARPKGDGVGDGLDQKNRWRRWMVQKNHRSP
jgi:hypothetical protein